MGSLLMGMVATLLTVPVTQATIAGTVRDAATGEPLAGAVVTLTDLDRATITGPDGRYLLRLVPAGPQHLAVRFIGYAPRTLHALVPGEGELEIDVALRPSPITLPSIDVRPSLSIRGGEDDSTVAFPDRMSSIAAVANHPLFTEPDVLQALGGGEVVLGPEAPSGVHIRGGDAYHTAYLIDGIPVFNPYHTAGVFSAWNPDALAQLRLSSTATGLADPTALSGSIEADTRPPEPYLRVQSGVSNTQARITLDGPLGPNGVAVLVSARTGLPNILPAKKETSYLNGGTSDWLAKVEAPMIGGRLRLLGYFSPNEIKTTSTLDDSSTTPALNTFEWNSRSLGLDWRRDHGRVTARVRGWNARGEASATWAAESAGVRMAAAREDWGLIATLGHRSAHATILSGIRLERSHTSYRIASDSATGPQWQMSAKTPIVTLFGEYGMPLGRQVDLRLGASVAVSDGTARGAPRVQVNWHPTDRLALSGSYARQFQFAQSLRNPESVVGTIFPSDLPLGASARGVPVARSDLVVFATEYRPTAALRLGVEGYARTLDDLLLVAPREGEPFALDDFTVGSGSARGLAFDASFSTRRFGLLASYAWQRIRREYGDSSYAPAFGSTHLLEGGVILFPTATLSARLGAIGIIGRHATATSGNFVWESCTFNDRGCEFRGSPHHTGEALGGTSLPYYLRVDLGIRKHWHVAIGRRDAVLGVFGTLTNLFDRPNVLTYARDSTTAALVRKTMRPRVPLVAGVDLRF